MMITPDAELVNYACRALRPPGVHVGAVDAEASASASWTRSPARHKTMIIARTRQP